jgi:rod shape-determining protein MreC
VDSQKSGFLSSVKGTVLTITYPIQYITYNVIEFVDGTITVIKDNKKLLEENKKLKSELDSVKFQLIELKNLENENLKLKELLKFIQELQEKTKKELSFVGGKVIGYSGDNWINSIIINVGKSSGIKEGDLVIADGYLVGIVSEVGQFSSSVLLVSNKNFKITCRTKKTREICFFQGVDNQTGKLNFVKPEQDIRIGDIIETTDLDGKHSGIPIGVVKEVSYEEGNFFKDVKVKLFLYPYSLEYVIVLTENREKNEKK